MGPMMRNALYTVPGPAGALAALALGADWRLAALGLAAYAASPPLGRTPRTLLLVAAPLLVAAGSPVPSLLSVRALVWIPIALALVAPIFLYLGARIPLRGLLPYLGLPPLMLMPLLLLPWAPTLFASDIATRSQIVLLAATLLLLGTILPFVRIPERPAETGDATYTPLLGKTKGP